MRLVMGSIFALLLLAGCQSKEEAAELEIVKTVNPEVETQRLNEWLDARFEEELQFSPIWMMFLGRKDLNDQLDDLSEKGLEKKLAWKRATVEQLKSEFDYANLTLEGKTSYDLWVYQYERAVAAEPFWRQGYNESGAFFFEQMFGAQSYLPSVLLNFHKVESAEDMQALISRIDELGRAIRQLQERAQKAASNGIRPPRFAYEVAIKEAQQQVTGAPFVESEADAPLWEFTKSKLDDLLEQGIVDQAKADELRMAAHTALHGEFLAAFDGLLGWLQDDIGNADIEPRGMSEIPGGKAFYNYALAEMTSTDLSAEEIHATGLAEVERIRAEMHSIMDEVGFDGDLKGFFTFLREDDQFLYPNTNEGREAYLADSRAFLNDIESKLPDYFGLLPKAELQVKRVEAFREQDGGVQHYFPGSPDGERPGVYYAHLSDMSAYSKSDMETVAYHEGNPGHHMQISIAQELNDIPRFRTQARVIAYGEGWGLYAEKLAEEMGAFKDPYKKFGRLNNEMWRAVRLVVDTGLHAKGWSQEQAVQYFLANSSLPEKAVRFEVQRYLTWPGQATAYKVGMLKILELRTRAMETLGEKFDIRGFHDAILGGGGLPLPMLEKRVDFWIEQQRTS